MPRISHISYQALLAMRWLGQVTVACPTIRSELIDGGLASDRGSRLEITRSGRAYLEAEVRRAP